MQLTILKKQILYFIKKKILYKKNFIYNNFTINIIFYYLL